VRSDPRRCPHLTWSRPNGSQSGGALNGSAPNSRPTQSSIAGIEAEVLPVAQRYGMGTLVWSPLAMGMLTGRIRKGKQTDLRRAGMFTSFSDERRLDVVEEIIPLAEEAGLPLTASRSGIRHLSPGCDQRHHRATDHGTTRRPCSPVLM